MSSGRRVSLVSFLSFVTSSSVPNILEKNRNFVGFIFLKESIRFWKFDMGFLKLKTTLLSLKVF